MHSTQENAHTGPDSQARAHNVASFLLRFTQDRWEDEQQEPHVRWRGHIRHVQGDDESRFTDFAQAVAFIQQNLTQLTVETLAGDREMSQEKIMRESFKLWEEFASSYSEIMLNAMEKTLEQTELLSRQADAVRRQTLQAWQMPQTTPTTDVTELTQAMQALQEEVASLSARVAELEIRLADSRGDR